MELALGLVGLVGTIDTCIKCVFGNPMSKVQELTEV